MARRDHAVAMTQDQRVLHALNRLAFGPRPEDIAEIRHIGLDRWIQQQLNPEKIQESSELLAKLEPLDTLRLTPAEMARKYPPPFQVKRIAEGNEPMPEDPDARVYVERAVARYRAKQSFGADDAAFDASGMSSVDSRFPEGSPLEQQFLRLSTSTPAEQAGLLEAMPRADRLRLLAALPPPRRNRLYSAASTELRRDILKSSGAPVMNQDLITAKILRAVYSNRQLAEVLTDFWFNHFNVFLDKGADRYLINSYERDAIRPHVLGKFQDLLAATVESPAMLFYLDNFQSVKPGFAGQGGPAAGAKRGLNENFARELMELHTLGVDGGYTQQDVTEVARCFTGWTIRQPRQGGGFYFNPRQHDNGEKHLLGVTIPAGGGIEDGYRVIDLLAHHPSTARFVSRALATRFVSDDPPESLVARMAETFRKKDGDLRAVMDTMIKSPEFWSADVYRAKIKSPFEMVVSAIRASGADVDFTFALNEQLRKLGEPLYRKQEPTGYSNRGADWLNSAALLERMNFGLALAANRIPGVRTQFEESSGEEIEKRLLGTEMTPESRDVVEKGLGEQQAPTPVLIAGLTLGSPDFQRR